MFAAVLLVVSAVLLGGCGSEGGGTTTAVTTPSIVSGLRQTGPGLTEPTKGSGARVGGGTVTFAEAPGSPPNYIFPMYPVEYCGTNNIDELTTMLYRPLYWYGDSYSPTIDYGDSIGRKPIFSNGGRTVTIHLRHYMWSDGAQVSARDLVFWINLVKADPAKNWCGYVAGKFPTNIVGYKAVNTTTLRLTFNRAYNPTWLLYNELSQLYTMPMAWDRTSLSQQAPNPDAAGLPDTTRAGAEQIYDFLSAQSLDISGWGSSPLWRIVDGPWRVQSTTSNGEITFVPNRDYSGPTKPSIAKFVEVPFTSESALVDQLRSQGPSGLTVASLPSQYEPLTTSFEREGYDVNLAKTYSINFFPLNLNNPTVGPVFRQLYFRQAFEHLVDQSGWIKSFLHNTAVPTYGPMPLAPPSKLVAAGAGNDPYPFSIADASQLLSDNGWKIVPGGSSYCLRPGTAAGECGPGINRGERISFTIDYESDVTAIEEELEDLQSQASKVGITITLTSHPYDDVISSAQPCAPTSPNCGWAAADDGTGWLYDYYPTGDELFASRSIENVGNYDSAEMDRLITATTTAPPAREAAAMKRYIAYTVQQLPVVFVPSPTGAFGAPSAGSLIDRKLGGFTPNAFGYLTPEDWYLTR